jgi:HEAT repeat protein
MSRRLVFASALALLPVVARAQPSPLGGAGQSRNQLRNSLPGQGQKPQEKAKLDEALHRFQAPDQPTRLDGVRMLGLVEDKPKAVAYLLEGASDSDTAIRLASIDTLGQISAKDAVGPLVQQLFMRGTDDIGMQHIVVALGRIGDSRATKPLVDFLARDTSPQLRGAAVFALGEIRDEDALEPLGRLAEETDDPSLRNVAKAAMEKIRDRPAPEVVPSALAQEQLRERAAAAAKGGNPSP